jgi:hypothetical protein
MRFDCQRQSKLANEERQSGMKNSRQRRQGAKTQRLKLRVISALSLAPSRLCALAFRFLSLHPMELDRLSIGDLPGAVSGDSTGIDRKQPQALLGRRDAA